MGLQFQKNLLYLIEAGKDKFDLSNHRNNYYPYLINGELTLVLKGGKRQKLREGENYRAINRMLRNEVKQARENGLERQCLDIETCLSRNNMKKSYELVINLTKKNNEEKSTTIQDKHELPHKEQNILLRESEYCLEIFNYKADEDLAVLEYPTRLDVISPIPIEEVISVIRALKEGKSVGIDSIPAELFQTGETMICAITSVCNKIRKTGEWRTLRQEGKLTAVLKLSNH